MLENVKVTKVSPCLAPSVMSNMHLETPELRYAAITWKYVEGNIIYCDTWDERATA
ncbi:cytoplasmic protein USSDB7A [Pantoea agglomerans]|nr:cytoplasmic protein USSDB7A [Pantoea agglomerans]NEG97273.1 cytoplasmic protein USSDB7A [Pantoea agglomerans]NEH04621.1 cytoplasmic protein USSDB7A [Pantoea agglomerans]NEH13977.1 cytoplasmic protein USSDB7A [Pantoea agglomerans]